MTGDHPYCAAVDWGTTSFRLWLLDRGGAVLAERRGDEGMTTARERGFAAVLESRLAGLKAPAGLPVVVCGMAGSKQGWREAPYLDAPARLGDVPAGAIRVRDGTRDVRILPGIAQRDPARPDVMRGEETQLLGAFGGSTGARLACLPGTHSKWVRIENGAVAAFATFMTGELFAVLARHSVLAHSLGAAPDADPEAPAFRDAARSSRAAPEGLTAALFDVRAGGLLGLHDPADAASRLSGTLIGAELAGASSLCGQPSAATLIASGRLKALYEGALAACGVEAETLDADDAARRGLFAAARRFWPLEPEDPAP